MDGGTAVAIQADSADPEQVAASVDEAVAQLGGLDILVNNAGVAYIGDIETFPLAEFDRLVAINVPCGIRRDSAGCSAPRTPAANHQHRQHQRRPGARPRPIRLRDDEGRGRRVDPGLARDLGPRGITVNNIQPGPIATDMNPEDGEFADA